MTRRQPPPPQPAMPWPTTAGQDMLLEPPPPMEDEEQPEVPIPVRDDRHLVDTPVAAEEAPELSPEEQIMFASLLTCGRRSKTLTLFDHTVVVQTLCGDDDLRIGLYAKDYVGSLGEQRAYQIAVAAAGIRSIDNQPLIQSLYEKADTDALFDQKVKKVAAMYPSVINRIYRAVLEAEQEFINLAIKLGKFDG